MKISQKVFTTQSTKNVTVGQTDEHREKKNYQGEERHFTKVSTDTCVGIKIDTHVGLKINY